MKKSTPKKSKQTKSNRVELALFGLVIIGAALVYFNRIWYLRFFTYDQARDALYVKRILDGKLRLIGTQSSIPGLYTAPLYYYLMAPFLAVFKLNPIGIDFGIGLITLSAGAILYWLLRLQSDNYRASLLQTIAFLFCAPVITQAQFGWNPNPMVLTTLLFILGCQQALVANKRRGWWLVGLSLGASINFHYSGLGLLAGLGVLLILFWPKIKKQLGAFSVGLLLLGGLLLPLLIFDLRHDFITFTNIWRYFRMGTGGEIPPPPFWSGLWEKHTSLIGLVFPFSRKLVSFLAVVWLVVVARLVYREKKASRLGLITISSVVYLVGLVFASLYRGSFFLFYLTFLYPLPFLITGLAYQRLHKVGRLAIVGLVTVGLILGARSARNQLSNSMFEGRFAQLDLVAFSFSTRLKRNENFNLAAVYRAEDRFDRNAVDYRYFLEAFYGIPVPGWDVLDYAQAETLYLISEAGPIDPLSTGIWELETFNPARVIGWWSVGEETIIYRLEKQK